MYQTCQNCSYESPIGARFCRQCGGQLFVETELSAAGTRNYGRQKPAPSVVVAGPGRLPPRVAEIVAGETERYYQAPYVPAPQTSPTAPIKSRIVSWRWVLLLFALLIGVIIGGLVTGGIRSHGRDSRTAEERDRNWRDAEARRRQDELRRDARNRERDAENRARDAQNHARDALNRSYEAAKQASEAGAAVAPTDEKLLDLSQYEYPKAPVSNSIRIPGRETLTIRTTDDFDVVTQFYQKKLGAPIFKVNESWEKWVIFQSKT